MSASTFTNVVRNFDIDNPDWSPGYAVPDGSYDPGLRLMHESASPVEQIKSGLSSFWGWVTGGAAKAWTWLKETLHLQGGADWVKATYHKGAGYVRATVAALGWSGVGGFGLLTVSTKAGRKVLHYLVGVPAGWAKNALVWGWTKTEVFFSTNLGGFGTWVADRMDDTEKFFYGKDGTSGVVGKVASWYIKYVGKHLLLDSTAMRFARLAGTMLFGSQLIAALPLLLTGSALTFAVYAGWVALIGLTGYQAFTLGARIGANPVVAAWLKGTTANIRAAAANTVTIPINVTTLKADVAAAVGTPLANSRPTTTGKKIR